MAKKKPTKNKTIIIVKKDDKKKKDYVVGYKKPSKAHQIKKGEVRNPKGINISPEKRALKELTVASVAEAIKKTLTCTEDEITALLADPATPVGHKVILRAALDAAHHGEYGKFDHILERAIGKTAIKVDMTSMGMPLGSKIEDKEKLKKVMKEVEEEF
jgi:recombinational DNA repair protein RecR